MNIHELALKGYCCSQIMIMLGLGYLNQENKQMVDAAAGLCFGMRTEKTCGVLTGTVLMLAMIDQENALMNMIPEFIEWFEEEYSEKHGGINCADILQGRSITKAAKCPDIMERSFEKAKELLSYCGHEWE